MQDLAINALPALELVAAPLSLALIAVGLLIGICLGILPGFGGAQALALMFPFTFLMPAEGAILFMVAIYSAAEYGGSIPAILIRTPGTSAAAMTVLDGYPMAKSGKAQRALMISITAAVFGGLMSSVIFLLAATGLAWIGLQFGPSEMFAIGVFGLAIIGSFVGRDPTKGFIAAGIGLLLSTIGNSGFGGMRFDFGQPYLADGIPLVVMIIAMLAAPEVFDMMRKLRRGSVAPKDVDALRIDTESRLGLRDLGRLLPTYCRGTMIGTAVGALPGPGPTVAALLAYNEEQRWSKQPAKFGTGVDEGVGAPESANNAVVAGALVPALALGVPGSGAIAVLLGVLISKGIVPGPTLFTDGGPLVLAVFFGLIAVNVMLLAFGVFGVRMLVPIARVPPGLLAPFVFVLLVVGAYAHDNNIAHSFMVIGFGAFAYILDKFGFSPVPLLLGFIMGPIIERNLNRALIISTGDLSEVFLRPITLTILVLAVLTAIFAYRRGRAYA